MCVLCHRFGKLCAKLCKEIDNEDAYLGHCANRYHHAATRLQLLHKSCWQYWFPNHMPKHRIPKTECQYIQCQALIFTTEKKKILYDLWQLHKLECNCNKGFEELLTCSSSSNMYCIVGCSFLISQLAISHYKNHTSSLWELRENNVFIKKSWIK